MDKGNVMSIAQKIEMMIDEEFRREQSKRNFEASKQYEMSYLNDKRNSFYKEFLSTVNAEEK